MKLLPQGTFTIHTTDPLPLLRERLSAKIVPVSLKQMRLMPARAGVWYRGNISKESFEIIRVVIRGPDYRNSSVLPVIYGRFESLPEGTAIHISMGMGINPLLVGLLGFSFLNWYSLAIPLALMTEFRGAGLLLIVIPTLLLIAFWLGVRFQTNQNRRELTQILLGQIELEPIRRNVHSGRFMNMLSKIWRKP